MLIFTLVLVICFDPCRGSNLEVQMLKDILLYRHAKRVLIINCNEELSLLTKELHNNGVYVQSKQHTSNESLVTESSSLLKSEETLTIVIDVNCPAFQKLLEKELSKEHFDGSRTWIFLEKEYKFHNLILERKTTFCLRLDSDVLWLQKARNDSLYHLIDLYGTSNKVCESFHTATLGHWKRESGLHIIDGFSKVKLRTNFHQHVLRGLLLHSALSENEITTKLNESITHRMLGHEKFHFAVLNYLQQVHNFSVKYEQSNEEFMKIISNFDVIGSGVFQSLQQNPLSVQILLQSWIYKLGFIFRLTPELNGATLEYSYFSPFTKTTWYSAASIFAVVFIVLQCITISHKELSAYAPNHFLIDMIGSVAQQGTTQTSTKLSVRIVLLAVLLMNFLFYNYYTASIVGELLSSSNQGPKTFDQLAKAPLSVVYNNDSYNRALAMNFYRLYTTTTKDGVPPARIYEDIPTAVRLLKQGSFAFHCELTEAFRVIADRFNAREICELRTMEGLYSELRLMSFVLPKKSMYTEQFKLTLTRATELGIIRRLLKTYNYDIPACQEGPLVHPVVLSGVSMPFMVLTGGFASSFVVLLLENIVHYVQKNGQTVIN